MTKKTTLINNLLYLITIVIPIFCYAQSGIVTGTLTSKDGNPLPGVSIVIKGQSNGTATDFDGYYALACNVGDILQINYLGFKTREVIVTEKMFDKNKKSNTLSLKENKTVRIKQEPVNTILSEAYSKNFQKNQKKVDYIGINENKTHKRKDETNYLNLDRLKKIKIDSNYVSLIHYDSDLFFDIEFNQKTTSRFVSKRNLHNLQTTFSQGPNLDDIFSFGTPLDNPSNETNRLFKNTFNIHSNLNLNITSEKSKLKLNYTNDRNESIFGVGKNKKNQYQLNYTYKNKNIKFESLVRYLDQENNQPNINGFNSNVIRSSFSTPPSFDNSQGFELSNDSQRSFNSNNFNNPDWLLNNNSNNYTNDSFLVGLKTELKIGNNLKLIPKTNYTSNKTNSRFSLPINTVGFINGYSSNKAIDQQAFDIGINLDLNLGSDFKYYFNTDFEHLDINYNLNETDRTIENNTLNNSRINNATKNSFRFSNKFNYDFYGDLDGFVSLTNHSLISSIQGNELLQPAISARVNFESIFYSSFLTGISLASTGSFGVNEGPLLYTNSGHSSLILNPIDSNSYTANDELFLNKNLSFEEIENYHFTLFTSFWHRVHFEFTQYHKERNNSILPLVSGTNFQLINAADIKTTGYEAKINLTVWNYQKFRYSFGANFSSYKNEVTKIRSNLNNVPVAGFRTISKNLVEGEPAGVIIGSAYERDQNNNIVIGNDGFPLVANELKIIGDPNPDFNVGITNSFSFGDLDLDFVIDIQKGGDVWNGTQQTLNFLGVSEESALLRNTENFIFNGVTTSGVNNTTSVNFLNPNTDISTNRFSRNGYTGIDEEAIVDGSYIHLKSIQISYNIIEQDNGYNNNKKQLIKEFNIGIYGNDLFTFSKFDGASPYTNLFDSASGNGLQFFNTPIISEIGIKAKIKF